MDAGHGAEYADFSEWDIYRSEVQLISLLSPSAAGDMVQSLVDDASQNGWLPKWAIVGGDESQMNGDSADPVIADAYAMGATHFDATAALRAMVKGATENETGHGLEIERQYLSQYLRTSTTSTPARSISPPSTTPSAGRSPSSTPSTTSPSPNWPGPCTSASTATDMEQRASNWEYDFDPATGYVAGSGHRTAASRPEPPSRHRSSSRGARPASRRATPSSTRGRCPRTSRP